MLQSDGEENAEENNGARDIDFYGNREERQRGRGRRRIEEARGEAVRLAGAAVRLAGVVMRTRGRLRRSASFEGER